MWSRTVETICIKRRVLSTHSLLKTLFRLRPSLATDLPGPQLRLVLLAQSFHFTLALFFDSNADKRMERVHSIVPCVVKVGSCKTQIAQDAGQTAAVVSLLPSLMDGLGIEHAADARDGGEIDTDGCEVLDVLLGVVADEGDVAAGLDVWIQDGGGCFCELFPRWKGALSVMGQLHLCCKAFEVLTQNGNGRDILE